MAKLSQEIIQLLNTEQLTSLQESLKREANLWKQSFKFIHKESHKIGPNYISDKFGLPEQTKAEPCWVHNRRKFLELLPPAELNILLAGDLEQRFDPFSYIWCYSYSEIAAPNPALLCLTIASTKIIKRFGPILQNLSIVNVRFCCILIFI